MPNAPTQLFNATIFPKFMLVVMKGVGVGSHEIVKKAMVQAKRGTICDAIDTLKHALALRAATLKLLMKSSQDTTDELYEIACLLQIFGLLFEKNGDDENAVRAFKEASKLFRKGKEVKEYTRFEV